MCPCVIFAACFLIRTDFSSFVTTVVLGNDLVCRLNFRSLCKLRNDVLDAISRARVNKMMIMQAIFKEFNSEDLMYPAGQEPDSPFKRGIEKFKGLISKRLQEQSVELGLPGKIIHFAKVSKCKSLTFLLSVVYFSYLDSYRHHCFVILLQRKHVVCAGEPTIR